MQQLSLFANDFCKLKAVNYFSKIIISIFSQIIENFLRLLFRNALSWISKFILIIKYNLKRNFNKKQLKILDILKLNIKNVQNECTLSRYKTGLEAM